MERDLHSKIFTTVLIILMVVLFATAEGVIAEIVKADTSEVNGDEGTFPWENVFNMPSSANKETTGVADTNKNENQATTAKSESIRSQDSTKVVEIEKPLKRAIIKKVKKYKKTGKISIKLKDIKGAAGYQFKLSTTKKFKNKKTKTVNARKIKVTIKKMNTKKKYYVKARAYKKVNCITVYGPWSKIKRCN